MLRTILRIANPLSRPGYVLPHAIIACIVGVALALSGVFAVQHLKESGGYKPAPLPPRTVLRGGTLPASWSLDKYVVRVHNQGSGNSCVAQTASTIEEILSAERHSGKAFSSGYVYDQVNGGTDSGTSYEQAFGILQSQGDAPLSVFPQDGQGDIWTQPGQEARAAAYPYHLLTWHSIAPSDTYTIRAEIHQGYPLAIAFPVYSSFYNQFGDGYVPTLSGEYGSFLFFHSVTALAYDPAGVTILNSWGPSWSGNGRAHLTWDFLTAEGASIVVGVPALAPTPPIQEKAHFPLWLWNQYRKEHKLHLIHARNHKHHLYESSWLWWKHHPKSVKHLRDIGGVVSATYTKQPHRRGYERVRFQRFNLYYWPHQKSYRPRWHKHGWIR